MDGKKSAMNKFWICAYGLLSTISNTVIANDDIFPLSSIDEYSFKGVLSESDAQLQFFYLPLEVLKTATSPKLLDIAVFDRHQKRLPSGVESAYEPYLSEPLQPITYRSELKFTELESNDSSAKTEYLIDSLGIFPMGSMETGQIATEVEFVWTQEIPKPIKIELLGQRKLEVPDNMRRLYQVDPLPEVWNSAKDRPGNNNTFNNHRRMRYIKLSVANDNSGFSINRIKGRYTQEIDSIPYMQGIWMKGFQHEGETFFEASIPTVRVMPSNIAFHTNESWSSTRMGGELYASNTGFENKKLLSRIRIYDHFYFNSGGFAGLEEKWQKIWLKPDHDINSVLARYHYRPKMLMFISNGQGPYTFAWGNAYEPFKMDGIEMLDIDYGEAYPPGELVKIVSIDDIGKIDISIRAPSVDTDRKTHEQLDKENKRPNIVEKSLLIQARKVDSDLSAASKGIKATLAFKPQTFLIRQGSLTDRAVELYRIKPVKWSDLPAISTSYLSKFNSGDKHKFEDRRWMILDFNGDSMSDWVGIQKVPNSRDVLDVVCVCTNLDDTEVILGEVIWLTKDHNQEVMLLGSQSVKSSTEKKQRTRVRMSKLEELIGRSSDLIFWTGDKLHSINTHDLSEDQNMQISCEKCIFYFLDYSYF